jgi:hypothetical protein
MKSKVLMKVLRNENNISHTRITSCENIVLSIVVYSEFSDCVACSVDYSKTYPKQNSL